MLKKSVTCFTRQLFKYESKRSLRHIRLLFGVSYMHNPGSEPLRYVTVGAAVESTAHAHPGRTALRSVHEDLTLTYEQLLTQADSLACALQAQGLEKGDRVGIWSHNSAAWVVALLATARAGLIAVAINPMYEKPELSFCIKKTELKTLLIGDDLGKRNYYDTVNQLIPELQTATPGSLKSEEFPTLHCVITCGKDNLPGTFTYKSLIADYDRKQLNESNVVGPDDGYIIYFTSGTTGNPKAPLISHFSAVNNSYFIGKRLTLNEIHHRVCVQAPLFHVLGSIITVLGSLVHGGSLVLASPTYNITSNINALYAEKCSVVTGTPTMYVDLISHIQTKASLPPNVKVALSGGAPCSPQLVRNILEFLKADSVKALYGLTETTSCVFQSLAKENVELAANTVGYIQDHVEAKVVDENGRLVPFGSPGELLIRGYCNMMQYWNDPEKTIKTMGEDGWLVTGDKFTLGEDGYGRIVGRLKDIIVRGGENIAPKEIEDVLNTHPDVIESQVIGVSDERLGEELCAVVRVREGACLDAATVARHCGGRLARFKIPRLLKLIDEFPKTTSGKIQKFKLKEMVESGKL